MRTYESIFILNPEIAGDDYTAAVDKYKGILADQDAEMLKVEEWGVRKLAYQVNKQARGNFIMFIFDAGPTVVKEFERRMRIDENVIKFQTILLEEGYVAPPVVEEPVAETATEEATTEVAQQAALVFSG